MEVLKKWKKNIIKRCKSTKEKNKTSSIDNDTLPKSKSFPPWSSSLMTTSLVSPSSSRTGHMTPGGCFSVYVGPERQRFVMKAKYASHPLFKMLLDDAREQYGYNSEGPLLLPCDVNLFCRVLAEMDNESTDVIHPHCCGSYGAYSLLSPSRLLKLNHV
ncbi:auxin-induced protein X10A-like [Silene latifolia]|uniref:auxin-induced protein X10A-like n=1 Tax=Silene latifolia TaxID=37657 RepID=UPI003D76CAE1